MKKDLIRVWLISLAGSQFTRCVHFDPSDGDGHYMTVVWDEGGAEPVNGWDEKMT